MSCSGSRLSRHAALARGFFLGFFWGGKGFFLAELHAWQPATCAAHTSFQCSKPQSVHPDSGLFKVVKKLQMLIYATVACGRLGLSVKAQPPVYEGLGLLAYLVVPLCVNHCISAFGLVGCYKFC